MCRHLETSVNLGTSHVVTRSSFPNNLRSAETRLHSSKWLAFFLVDPQWGGILCYLLRQTGGVFQKKLRTLHRSWKVHCILYCFMALLYVLLVTSFRLPVRSTMKLLLFPENIHLSTLSTVKTQLDS